MFEVTEQQLGKVDVLVNNAGVLKTVPLADTSDALYDQTFDINVRGTFNTLREAAARMNDGGRIVNFSSTTLALNMPGYAIYNATKAAVEAFTHVFAKELRGRNITVNAVAPGPIATSLFLDGKTEEQIQTFAKMPPLQRLGQPDDIASVVSFLAGPDAGWVNGQILRANGGCARCTQRSHARRQRLANLSGAARRRASLSSNRIERIGATNGSSHFGNGRGSGIGKLSCAVAGRSRPHRVRDDARYRRPQPAARRCECGRRRAKDIPLHPLELDVLSQRPPMPPPRRSSANRVASTW